MIGENIVNALSSAGGALGYYASQGISKSGQFVNEALGQAFTNPGKLYTDLSTGVLDALINKTAVTVVTAGMILVPAALGVGLASKGLRTVQEGMQLFAP